jgi:hypothetical protein
MKPAGASRARKMTARIESDKRLGLDLIRTALP